MRIAKLAAIVFASSLLAVGLSRAADAPQPALDLHGVRILVCTVYGEDVLNYPVVQRLIAAGAAVRSGNLAELTWDTARQYHLIIATEEPPIAAKAAGQGPVQVLEKFVRAGGGLLFFGSDTSTKDDTNRYLAPFGASLRREFVQDPQHTFQSPTGFNLVYAYTESVTSGHPVTAGVKGIWYNAQLDLFRTSSIDVAKDWQVLVTGAASATTSIPGSPAETPGKFQSSPPIMAARELDAGAVVLIGLSPHEAFYGQGLPAAYHDIVMAKGDGLRRSDFGRLYDNALGWLAQHGQAAKELGQGELKPVINSWANQQTVDWSKDVLAGERCAKPSKGVVGLHSNLSDGEASPEALIAQAKACGLNWVAFTEKLELLAAGPWTKRPITFTYPGIDRTETLAPEKWERLRKICKEASTADFAVLPGLDYATSTGDRWVAFGDFDWPQAQFFSKDRKALLSPLWWFDTACVPNGPYNATKNHFRPWDYSLYNLWPVRTTVAGKPTDEAAADFGYLQAIQDDPFPMAVDLVYNETQLAAAARRMVNYAMTDRPANLTKFYRDHCYYWSHCGFVSDGPVVTDWRCANGTRVTGGKWYLPSTERYRVKLSVHSDAPISDIRIYDGPDLFRRFCPTQATVTVTFDAPHDQQRNLFAVVTDAAGKQAITGGFFIQDWLNYRFMCSDRGNALNGGIQTDELGPYLTGTATLQRKKTPWGLAGGYSARAFKIIYFDGGVRNIPIWATPTIQMAGASLAPPQSTLESRMEIPLASCDGITQADTITGYFPGVTDSWHPAAAPEDIKDVRINYRYLNVTPSSGGPGAILVEGRIGFAKAAEVASLMVFNSTHGYQVGEGDHYALVTPADNVAGLASAKPLSVVSAMAPGSYVAVFPMLSGAVAALALDDGYVAALTAQAPRIHMEVGLGQMPRHVQAGEEINYRLLLVRGRSPDEPPNTAEWNELVRTMGLRGPPAYAVNDIKAGKVKSTRFLLELEPADGAFVGTITQAALPMRLPIRVAGMNPNWTFAWFDLDRKEWFPSAVDRVINQGYFTLDTRVGDHRIFAGHPVVADNKDLRISVLSDGRSKIQASVNNVGDAGVAATIRLNPALGQAAPVTIKLGPGETKDLEFPFGI